MQNSDFRNQYDLFSKKIVLSVVIILAVSASAFAQNTTRWIKKNNPNYDDRKVSYGFVIGLHTSTYKIRYSDKFVSQALDTLHSVEPAWTPGFSLGFIVNFKLAENFDLRLTPNVAAFYEHSLTYRFTDDTPVNKQTVETTMSELPILLKYKSERRGNIRMYMVGGIKPGIEVSGKKKLENVTGELEVKGVSVNADFGFGFEMYYPLFKFCPEIRFSKGLNNILDNTSNIYGQPLDRITTNTITVYLLFQ